MLRKLSVLLVLVSCSLMVGCKISGTITDEFGTAIKDVEVVLSGQEGKMTIYTDDDGKYAFNNLLPGKYTVTPSSSDKYDFTPTSVQLLTDATIVNFKGDDLWRFTDMDDGTIRDNDSGLVWLKDASCLGTETESDAHSAVAALSDGICGLTDESLVGNWRVPSSEDWLTLVDDGYDNPALSNTAGTGQWTNGDAFTNVQSVDYWGQRSESEPHFYKFMDMSIGKIKTDDAWYGTVFHVWPVRDAN